MTQVSGIGFTLADNLSLSSLKFSAFLSLKCDNLSVYFMMLLWCLNEAIYVDICKQMQKYLAW